MTIALPFPDLSAGATFDPDRFYRYTLWRIWAPTKGRCLWVMLNPSTADESVLDPTIRRCMAFSRSWGFGSLEVCNLFALRSTNPDALYSDSEPVGIRNDKEIKEAADRASRIIVAWGVHGAYRNRGAEVTQMLIAAGHRLECLGRTKDGYPRHPLYVRADTELEQYAE